MLLGASTASVETMSPPQANLVDSLNIDIRAGSDKRFRGLRQGHKSERC